MNLPPPFCYIVLASLGFHHINKEEVPKKGNCHNSKYQCKNQPHLTPTYQLDMITAITDCGKEPNVGYTLAYIATPIVIITVVVLVATAVVLKRYHGKIGLYTIDFS